jgi:hypothetical protein
MMPFMMEKKVAEWQKEGVEVGYVGPETSLRQKGDKSEA